MSTAEVEGEPRKFMPGLGDLIDLLTVTQLRLIRSASVSDEDLALHSDLTSDIDAALNHVSGKYSQIVERSVALSYINAEIWDLKDAMTIATPAAKEYSDALSRAHQLNGYRTHARNELNLIGKNQKIRVMIRTNLEPDGLKRWVPTLS